MKNRGSAQLIKTYEKNWFFPVLIVGLLLICSPISAESSDPELIPGYKTYLEITEDDGPKPYTVTISPDQSGEYIFTSFGSAEPEGNLYTAAWKEITMTDAGGHDGNFCLTCNLSAGEYHFVVTSESSFSMLLRKYNWSVSGDNWALNNGVLTVSGTEPMPEYLAGGTPWYEHYITSVVIENGVSKISDFAFSELESLTSVSIPGSVTEIGRSAFFGCTGLSSVNIPSNVSNIGYRSFEDCTGLVSLTIQAGVSYIEMGAFSGCRSLTTLTLPASVTKIGDDAFAGCINLEEVTINQGTMSIGRKAFKNCESLFRVSIPNSIAWIGNEAFSGCFNLMNISIPYSAHLGGPDIFTGCMNLSGSDDYIIFGSQLVRYTGHSNSIDIPGSVTKIADYAFYGYSVDASVTVSSSVTEIGDFAFACWGTGDEAHMSDIEIPASVMVISSSAFFQTEIRFRPGDPNFVIENGLLINYIGTDPNPVIPDGVTAIGFCAFANREDLQSVTLPASLTSIGVRAFQNCPSLTDIHGVSGSTCFYYFYDAYHVGRNGLYRISLPASIQFQDVGTDAFSGTPLGTLLTPDFIIPGSTAAIEQEAFSGIAATYIVIPESVTEISSKAFANCTQLRYICIWNTNCTIADNAFDNCNSDLIFITKNDFEGIPSKVHLYTDQHGFRFVGDDDFGNG